MTAPAITTNPTDAYVPLVEPPNPKVNIVFVHGLGGGRLKTWSRKDFLWPKELLPLKIPEARIFSWGHNAELHHIWGSKIDQQSTQSYAEDLLQYLQVIEAKGSGDTANHALPIILVAHSLGGIICAQALLLSYQQGERAFRVGQSIRGIAFMGTPLNGAKVATWKALGLTFAGFLGAATDQIRDIQQGSQVLKDMTDRLSSLVPGRAEKQEPPLHFACFFESDTDPVLRKKIVTREEATWPLVKAVKLAGHHRSMCRFDNEDSVGYPEFVDVMKFFIREMNGGTSNAGNPGVHMTATINGDNIGGLSIGNLHSNGSPAVKDNQFGHRYYRTPPPGEG